MRGKKINAWERIKVSLNYAIKRAYISIYMYIYVLNFFVGVAAKLKKWLTQALREPESAKRRDEANHRQL
jgi:hypothetical protein